MCLIFLSTPSFREESARFCLPQSPALRPVSAAMVRHLVRQGLMTWSRRTHQRAHCGLGTLSGEPASATFLWMSSRSLFVYAHSCRAVSPTYMGHRSQLASRLHGEGQRSPEKPRRDVPTYQRCSGMTGITFLSQSGWGKKKNNNPYNLYSRS